MRLPAVALLVAFVVSCGDGGGPLALGPGEPPTDRWPLPTPLEIEAPEFPRMPVPMDNPTTVEGVALGRRLFYDPILSADSSQSCADCHRFGSAFSDDRRFSIGIDGIEGTRNAPALVNVGWLPTHFWDGRAASLEEQALEPVVNPVEMHESWPHVEDKIGSHPEYPELFGRAFGSATVTRSRITRAIAQFERTFVSNDSRYDRYRRGMIELSELELRGMGLFFTEIGDCFHCHVDGLFTDGRFHNVGLDAIPEDRGRIEVTGVPADLGLFKTPTLRNVEFTAPYMHDGRFETLEEVLAHYNSGGHDSPTVDPLMRKGGVGLGLTREQILGLVAFLRALSDESFLNRPFLGPPNGAR